MCCRINNIEANIIHSRNVCFVLSNYVCILFVRAWLKTMRTCVIVIMCSICALCRAGAICEYKVAVVCVCVCVNGDTHVAEEVT